MNTSIPTDIPHFARTENNLASAGLGAVGLSATDEFFAPLHRMLQDSDPVFIPDKYDEHGKWMDGWETRRRRNSGHDHAVIRLGAPGAIFGFDVDTSHFTGNYPPACRIEACFSQTDPDENTVWSEILPSSPLGPDSHHYFPCRNDGIWTHLRLHIMPDGGIARFRAYGRARVLLDGSEIDLAAALNGGKIIAYSDAHYGDVRRLIAPGRGVNMGDGWETRRRRKPGHDWIIIRLGVPGIINRVLVDTAFFKGNYPDACSLRAAFLPDSSAYLEEAIIASSMFWDEMMSNKKLSADSEHEFSGKQLKQKGPVSHIKLNIYPDGGVSRLRLFGQAI